MYQVYIDGVELPIAPKNIQTKINGNNKTVNLINEGEVNILKLPGLTDIDFDMNIPHHKLPFVTNLMSVDSYLSKLEDLKVNKKKFQFIVIRKNLYNTNMKVTLEDYRINEDANDGPMTVINVVLKQYKDFGEVVVKMDKKKVGDKTVVTVQKEKERVTSKTPPKQHKVKSGDTLWAIAKKELGDGSRYQELADLNGISNPNVIIPGQVIRFE